MHVDLHIQLAAPIFCHLVDLKIIALALSQSKTEHAVVNLPEMIESLTQNDCGSFRKHFLFDLTVRKKQASREALALNLVRGMSTHTHTMPNFHVRPRV